MKTNVQIIRNFFFYAFFMTFIFSFGNIKGQEVPVKKDSLDIEQLPFAISEIPSEFSRLSNRLDEISEIIEPDQGIVNNDSIVREYSIALLSDKKEIIAALPAMNYQRLENLIRAWKNYHSKFGEVQGVLKGRINEMESINNELDAELEQWERLSENLEKRDYPKEFKQDTDSIITILNLKIIDINERADSLLLMQNQQAKFNEFIDDMISILEEEQQAYQSSYLIIDSNPIWSVSDSAASLQNIRTHFKAEFNENYNILKTYLISNKSIVLLQLIFIILLIGGFIFINRIWPTSELSKDSKRELQAGFIIHRPFFSSLLISIIFSVFFYTNRPLVLAEFFVLLMLISSLVLLPGLLTKKIKIPLLLLSVLFIINVIQDFLPYQSLANRMIILLQSVATLFLLFKALQINNEFVLKPRAERFFKSLLKVFGVLMIIAFTSNIIGSVKLASFLISSTIRTLNISVIIVTIVIILNSMMVLLIKGKKAQSIPLYDELKVLIDTRIRPLINWGGFILWIISVLTYFRLLKLFQNFIERLMDTEFLVASVAISIGGIISFFLIAFFTYILVRFVKNIFKDKWVSKSGLPRGSADALSMLIRYTIVAFGIYLALNAIGVEMNKFGFMAGALGVGIGFGLQNVVLNFFAGLILTFERPFHVGDVIEVDQYMGRVTEIGVRASKMLTWDGSEVIVPNGSLITNKVVNWTLTNQKRRLVIIIRTSFDADLKKVMDILKMVATNHPNTIDHPAPMVVFNGYGSSSLDFTLYCWVDFSVSLSTKSDIAISAHESLAEAGIPVPLPVQKLHIERDNTYNTPTEL